MRAILALIFFLSGASALVFESLWFRLAGLSLGNSVWSASLVLAAFMGGLALGNAVIAALHARMTRPVRLYAVLELTIGIAGFSVVLLLPQFPALLGPLLGGLADTPMLLNGVRLTIAFLTLLLPAIAMGATLPVLVHALSLRDSNFGSSVGWLYGWNTLGAMLGVIAAEVLFVPAFGVKSSGLIALSFNLAAAVIALRVAETDEEVAAARPLKSDAMSIDSRTWRYIAIGFFSGAVMLALEVVWFRYLLLTRDGTSLIFAVMLAVVLAGIALGGLAAGHLFRRDDRAYRWLSHVTAVSAALVVLTYWGYDLFSSARASNGTSVFLFVTLATFLMFPVAFLSGVIFTMVNRAVRDSFGSSARTTGIATFCNTTGAMLGSLAAGFVLLPMIGMETSFFLIATLYAVLAFVVPTQPGTSRAHRLWSRGAIAAGLGFVILFPFGLMQESYFKVHPPQLPDHTLVASREGLVETIRYYSRDRFGEPMSHRLVTNGHSMSSTSTASKRYMKLYVYLPLALKPDSDNALLISFGVGSTAKALTDSAGLEHIDVVDISRDVLEMSNIVYPGAGNPLRDRRVDVHVEDGRFFLNTTENHYDLITSEPPPPALAGVVNLYSQEYFELIRERLSPGGYATYWLPVVQLSPGESMAITKAFCNAFEDCSLWAGSGLEWMLVGSKSAGRQTDAEGFAAQWHDPVVGPELDALGIESPEQLGSLFMADAELLDRVTADILPVRDNHPGRITADPGNYVERVDLYADLMDETERRARFKNSELIARLWPEGYVAASEPYFRYERLIKHHFTLGAYREPSEPYIWKAIDGVLTDTSLTTLPLWLLGSDRAAQNIVTEVLDRDGYQAKLAPQLARRHTAERDFDTALMYMQDHVTKTREVSLRDSNLYLYLLAKTGRAADAEPIIEQLGAMNNPEINRFLDWYRGRFDVGGEDGERSAFVRD